MTTLDLECPVIDMGSENEMLLRVYYHILSVNAYWGGDSTPLICLLTNTPFEKEILFYLINTIIFTCFKLNIFG